MYLHIKGHGHPIKLAIAIRSAWELTNILWNNKLHDDSYAFSIAKQKLDKIFRHKGTVSVGVYPSYDLPCSKFFTMRTCAALPLF